MDVQIHTDPHTIESASTNKTKTTKKEKCSLFFFNSGIHEFSPATKKRDIATSRRTPTSQKGISKTREHSFAFCLSLLLLLSFGTRTRTHEKARADIYTEREERWHRRVFWAAAARVANEEEEKKMRERRCEISFETLKASWRCSENESTCREEKEIKERTMATMRECRRCSKSSWRGTFAEAFMLVRFSSLLFSSSSRETTNNNKLSFFSKILTR